MTSTTASKHGATIADGAGATGLGPPRWRVPPGVPIRLADVDPGFDEGLTRKKDAEKALEQERKRIYQLQAKLYAESRHGLLVVLQAMDTGGKDGTVKHVFRGVNPQGCEVTSFKTPSDRELAHDFLWRIHPHVPAKGMVGIFNRSHYEDVLVVRVHKLVPSEVWKELVLSALLRIANRPEHHREVDREDVQTRQPHRELDERVADDRRPKLVEIRHSARFLSVRCHDGPGRANNQVGL